jgi:hypothetical protein
MPMDISKFVEAQDFTLNIPGGSPLRISGMTTDASTALRKKFRDALAAEPADFVRTMLSHLAYHVADNGRRGKRLSEQEIAALDEHALQEFAKTFVTQQTTLFDDTSKDAQRVEGEPAANGSKRVRYKYDKLDIPRAPDDTDLSYLQRVVGAFLKRERASEKRLREQMLKLAEPYASARKVMEQNEQVRRMLEPHEQIRKALGPNSVELLRDNSAISDRLGESLRASADLAWNADQPFAHARAAEINVPLYVPPPNPLHKTNEHLEEVIDHLNAISPVVTDSATLIKSMNDLGVEMATTSAANAARTAKQNQVTIAIGVIAIVVSAIFSVATFVRDFSKDSVSEASSQKLIGELSALRKESAASRDALNARLEQIAAKQVAIESASRAGQKRKR